MTSSFDHSSLKTNYVHDGPFLEEQLQFLSLLFVVDSEYTSKDVATSPSMSVTSGQGNSCGESNSKGIAFVDSEHCFSQIQKLGVDSNKSSSSSATLRMKLDSSFYFDVKNDKSLEEKQGVKSEGKTLSECSSKRSELWTKKGSSSSISLQGKTESKPTASEDRDANPTSEGISMEDLVSKSISRSAVEPPLINSDAPLMRYKFFECRNYGDVNYDKCIRTSEVEQKGTAESKATLAPIRYPELVRNGANSEAASNYGDFKRGSSADNLRDGKLISKNVPVPSVSSRTRSPVPEVVSRNLSFSDKSRTSAESKSPSTAKHLSSSRSGFHLTVQSASLPMAGSKVHSSMADRRSPSHPFQPVIVKHEFQSAEGNKGIKQEARSTGVNQSESKAPFISLASERGKQSAELKGGLGFNESSTSISPRPSQETEDYEKSYKATSRTLSRPHPTLISRNTSSLPPSLPVGVAHPYPRASDGMSTSNHSKSSEHKTSAPGSSVTSGNGSSIQHYS